MSARDETGGDERAEPLPAPIPGPEFKRLSRAQSILAWTLGSIVGLAVAVGVILALVLR